MQQIINTVNPIQRPAPTALDMKKVRGEVEFRDVYFAYQPRAAGSEDISFQAQPNEMVALVGRQRLGQDDAS